MLIEGVKRYGQDYEKISKMIKTKSVLQIKSKVYRHAGPDSECETLFPDMKLKKFRRWTADENKTFWKVIEKHGVNDEKLEKALPMFNLATIRNMV